MDFHHNLFTYYQMMTGKDTGCRHEMMMKYIDKFVPTPAGLFKTITAEYKFSFWPGWHNGQDSVKYAGYSYAESVGLVKRKYMLSFMSKSYSEERLLRYKVR
jgi:hypothetical protein